jgi:hypothetical protein
VSVCGLQVFKSILSLSGSQDSVLESFLTNCSLIMLGRLEIQRTFVFNQHVSDVIVHLWAIH